MYMCVHTHICTYINMCTYIYIYTHSCIYENLLVLPLNCIYVYMNMYMCNTLLTTQHITHTKNSTEINVCCLQTLVYSCIHIHIHIHIYTHTYIHENPQTRVCSPNTAMYARATSPHSNPICHVPTFESDTSHPHIQIRNVTSPHSNQTRHVPTFKSDMSRPHIRIRHVTSPHSNPICHDPTFESDMSCPHTRIYHVTPHK